MAYASFPPEVGAHSPSGTIDSVLVFGSDAAAFGTENRGGVFVSPEAVARMPQALRPTDDSVVPGWFEGTTDWALPYLALSLNKHEADPTRAADLWVAALKSVEAFYPERLASIAAASEQSQENGYFRERLAEAAERYAAHVGDSANREDAHGFGLDDAPEFEPELPDELFLDRAQLSDLHLVNRCRYQISMAPLAIDPSPAETMEMARHDLEAARDRPAIMAAFADSFIHPDMVAKRLERPTDEDGMLAAGELLAHVRNALVDQHAAAETREVLRTLKRLEGPTPWDTFFEVPGAPDEALMPLFGCKNADVLGLGPIDRPGQRWSGGGQPLFYPVGGYGKFAEAASVIVAQTLADGLAIDAALRGEKSSAVIVTSDPDNVHEVCFSVNMHLSKRAAVASPGERQPVSVVAAVSEWYEPDNEAIKRLELDAPRNGTSIIRPNSAPVLITASWPILEPDSIAESVRSAQESSSRKMGELAARPDPGGFDYADGLRASVRELREALREEAPVVTLDAPKIEEAQTRTASRRL